MSSEDAKIDEEKIEDAKPEWPRVVKLQYPIEFAGETIAELTFQRGKVAHIKGIVLKDEVPANDLITIASRLCGRQSKVIESLDAEDAGEVMEIALGFFERCLVAGKKR